MVFDKFKILCPFTIDAQKERFLFWKEDTFTDPFPHNLHTHINEISDFLSL
jgi:hypothetical protein